MKTLHAQPKAHTSCPKLRQVAMALMLGAALISGCATGAQYGSRDATRFLLPLGLPPAETLVWSPKDGDKILVSAAGVGSGPARIYILDTSQTTQRILAQTRHGGLDGMSWSPDGKTVVLAAEPGTLGYESRGVWLMNLEDNSETSLDISGYIKWSPNANLLAYLSFSRLMGSGPRGIELHLFDLVTRQDRLLYHDDQAHWFFGLTWSPDARFIAFSKGDVSASDILIYDVSKGQLIPITSSGDNSYPAWSPAGNVIAYTKVVPHSGASGARSTIHLVYSDGTCDTELPKIEDAISPAWSPDGNRLAFIGSTGIYVTEPAMLLGRDFKKALCAPS